MAILVVIILLISRPLIKAASFRPDLTIKQFLD
jgi:hypothetical protein